MPNTYFCILAFIHTFDLCLPCWFDLIIVKFMKIINPYLKYAIFFVKIISVFLCIEIFFYHILMKLSRTIFTYESTQNFSVFRNFLSCTVNSTMEIRSLKIELEFTAKNRNSFCLENPKGISINSNCKSNSIQIRLMLYWPYCIG